MSDRPPSSWSSNPFTGKEGAELPRPERSDPRYANLRPHELATKQQQWDDAAAMRQEREAWLKGIQDKKQAEAEAAETARAEAAKAKSAADRANTLATLKRQYLSVPGTTAADWDAEDHDALIRQVARDRALRGNDAADEAARRAHARSYAE